MPDGDEIDVIRAITAVVASHRKFTDLLMVVQRTCTTTPACKATTDAWIVVLDHLGVCTDDLLNLGRTMKAYAEYVGDMRRQLFLSGFYEALRRTDRLDLLEVYPEVDRMAAIVEAQRLLGREEPPPTEGNGDEE